MDALVFRYSLPKLALSKIAGAVSPRGYFGPWASFRLEDAPGGKNQISRDEAVMTRGKLVFAENCAQCHSSKRPPAGVDSDEWFRQDRRVAAEIADSGVLGVKGLEIRK